VRLSKEFLVKLKFAGRPAYRIGFEAGLTPNALYKLTAGITPIKENDSRVLAVAKILGLDASECFEREEEVTRLEPASAEGR
jgi:hypothetical protein